MKNIRRILHFPSLNCALGVFLLVATLSLVPRRVHAQLYVGEAVAGTGQPVNVAAYDSTLGFSLNGVVGNGLAGNPTGVAVYGNEIFFTNSFGGTVAEYNTTTGAVINASAISGLTNPHGLLVVGNTLYVSSGGSNILTYNLQTGTVTNASFVSSGLSTPEGMAVSGNTLYVASAAGNSVATVNLSNGQVNASFITGLSDPTGLAISGNNLYVANFFGNDVGEYSLTNGSAENASLISGLGLPWGLAISGNSLYVSDEQNDAVGLYNLSTSTFNANFITTSLSPQGLAVVSVPEPSAAISWLGGVLVVACGRWRSAARRRIR